MRYLLVCVSIVITLGFKSYDFENALNNKDYERFEIMLLECKNVSNIQNTFGDTLLHITVMYDRPDFLQRIIALNQIDINKIIIKIRAQYFMQFCLIDIIVRKYYLKKVLN